jgi:hypothetical protein
MGKGGGFVAEGLNPEPTLHEEVGNERVYDEHGQVSIRVDKEDHEVLIRIKAKAIHENPSSPITIASIIHDMVEKWDSLLKSYEELKKLPEA